MPTIQPSPIDPATPTPDDLDLLVKTGLRLARLLERHVEAIVVIAEAHAACELPDPFPLPPMPNYPPDIGLTFSRIARAVRLTKALQARLARPPRNPSAAADPDMPDAARQAALNALSRRPPLQDPDGDRVEPPDSAERLDHEIWENLEDPDTDGAILARPVSEIIAVIRDDLGFGDSAPNGSAPDQPPPAPESVGVVRVVRGQTLQPQGRPPPEGREATNHTNHTNVIVQPPQSGRPPWCSS